MTLNVEMNEFRKRNFRSTVHSVLICFPIVSINRRFFCKEFVILNIGGLLIGQYELIVFFMFSLLEK